MKNDAGYHSLRLDQVISYHAEANPDGEALIYAREAGSLHTLTWRNLDRWADAFARTLYEAGVSPGARCAVMLNDEMACVAAIYGAWRAGCVVVPIDTQWGRATISGVLRHADVHAIAGCEADARSADGILASGGVSIVPFCEAPSQDVEAVRWEGSTEQPAMIAFTSGSTAEPKGVMLRHRHLRAAYDNARRDMDLAEPRRFGCVYRLSGLGVFGSCFLLAHECGAAAVVMRELSLETARDFWHDVDRLQIDFIYLVPALIQIINRLSLPPGPGAHRPLLMTGAAPIVREAHAELQSRFGVVALNAYGLTEASFAVFFGLRDDDGRGTVSIGPARSVEARLVGNDGETIAGPGRGHMQFRGSTLTEGYFRNAEATEALFEDGWLVTGDIADRDAAGNYYIVGRQKDVVIRGGFNIYLQEVDEVLMSHKSVVTACSVGLSDPVSGEDIYALVKLKDDPDVPSETDLLSWCKAQLGKARAPRRILMSSEDLPRNGAGKIVRREAREIIVKRLSSLEAYRT